MYGTGYHTGKDRTRPIKVLPVHFYAILIGLDGPVKNTVTAVPVTFFLDLRQTFRITGTLLTSVV